MKKGMLVKMKNQISTPFGSIFVKQNGQKKNFKYQEKNYYYEKEGIKMYLIEIDTLNMNIGDTILCGLDNPMLEINDSDQNSILISVENDKFLLGLCGYDTEVYEGEEVAQQYSYELDDYHISSGFLYTIKRDPKDYINSFYESRVITFGIAWVEKDKFADPDTAIFLALTSEIG